MGEISKKDILAVAFSIIASLGGVSDAGPGGPGMKGPRQPPPQVQVDNDRRNRRLPPPGGGKGKGGGGAAIIIGGGLLCLPGNAFANMPNVDFGVWGWTPLWPILEGTVVSGTAIDNLAIQPIKNRPLHGPPPSTAGPFWGRQHEWADHIMGL